ERLRDIGSMPDRRGLMIGEIDGAVAHEHPMVPFLREVGFQTSQQGYYLPRSARTQVVPLDAAPAPEEEVDDDEADNG
ncbi:MAG TPA: hypothetical protein VMF89_23085, partial [Polyangiales bacterium]|nr:hypothetical protein [Polyangiales bacterium]